MMEQQYIISKVLAALTTSLLWLLGDTVTAELAFGEWLSLDHTLLIVLLGIYMGLVLLILSSFCCCCCAVAVRPQPGSTMASPSAISNEPILWIAQELAAPIASQLYEMFGPSGEGSPGALSMPELMMGTVHRVALDNLRRIDFLQVSWSVCLLVTARQQWSDVALPVSLLAGIKLELNTRRVCGVSLHCSSSRSTELHRGRLLWVCVPIQYLCIRSH